MQFSRRLPSPLTASPLAQARAAAGPLVDLTESNPGRCGFSVPSLQAPLCGPLVQAHASSAGGTAAARAALSAHLAELGQTIPPERLLLTASTSEAYGMLFKLLCDPGDRVAMPVPTYPLLQHLAELESLQPQTVPMTYAGRWRLDLAALAAVCASGCRLLALVSPSSPTGAALLPEDWAAIGALARAHDLPVLVDQVFAAYAADGVPRWPQLDAPLWFSLDGLSKLAGMPQVKLGWIGVHGDPARVAAAQARLAWIADASLSLSAPTQLALPQLLAVAAPVRQQIQARLRQNHACLAAQVAAQLPMLDLLQADAGWYAMLRLPQEPDEDAVVRHLMRQAQVFVHPGYLYDVPRRGHLVFGLLLPPEIFAAAIGRLSHALRQLWPEPPGVAPPGGRC